MPSFGALRNIARGASVEKKVRAMTIKMPQAGGANQNTTVEHEHEPPHPKERFQFAPNENPALAAHIQKHLGLKLPGKAAGDEDSAEPEVSKGNFSGPANGHR
jgi:hypothetical protein